MIKNFDILMGKDNHNLPYNIEIFGPPQKYETVNGTLNQIFLCQYGMHFDITHFCIMYATEANQRKSILIFSELSGELSKSNVVS